jgi:hypothetical protein
MMAAAYGTYWLWKNGTPAPTAEEMGKRPGGRKSSLAAMKVEREKAAKDAAGGGGGKSGKKNKRDKAAAKDVDADEGADETSAAAADPKSGEK